MSTVTLGPAEYEPDPFDPGPGPNRVAVRWAVLHGREVVVRTGTGRHRSRLRREAAVLAAVGGWPVPELLRCDEGELTTTLVMSAAGTALDAGSDPSVDAAGNTVGQLLRAVAALHEAGWAHGRLAAEHLVLDHRVRRRSVRCCSLGEAVPVGDPAHAETVDADLRALLHVATTLLEGVAPTGGPVARRRAAARLARGRALLRRRLTSGTRPGQLREVAGELEGLLDRHPRRAGARRTPPPAAGAARAAAGSRRRWRRPAAALPLLALTVALVVGPADARTGGPVGPRDGSDGPAASGGSTAAPPEVPCTAPAPNSPDVGGDGCGDATALDGRRITWRGRTYLVGAPGDRVALGDADCDGTASVVVLRPATGEVFEFDRWPSASDPVVVSPAATVAGARSLRIRDDGACRRPLVERTDGTVVDALTGEPVPGGP